MEPDDQSSLWQCRICSQPYSTSSNLNRHMKIHEVKQFKCERCLKTFTLKQHLNNHQKLHDKQDSAPQIRYFKKGEALMKASEEAKRYENFLKLQKVVVEKTWCDPVTAEAMAKSKAGEAWRGEVKLTFGKYINMTFRWLVENDVGWLKWLLVQHATKKECNPLMLWLKKTLWDYASQFPEVMCHVDCDLKKQKKQLEPSKAEQPYERDVSKGEEPSEFIDDKDLLEMADNLLTTSELGVKTQITMARDLLEASTSIPETVTSIPETVTDPGLEGWQKSWEEPPPNTLPMYQPNIQWLKNDPVFGLYTKEGSRKVLKPMMIFNPPPLFSRVESTLPSMLSFFRTPTFFWRPVGVMQLKVPCPNTDCPAPSGYSLVRHGYGSVARTVFGMKFPYTLLTERLICHHCMEKRRSASDKEKLQYSWNSSSSSVLQQLAPAVRSMFPAVIVGKRAVDKEVVTLLTDRINSVSMSKVYRVLEMGHGEWYAERRDWYQTLLYKAHSAESSGTSQRGILPFIKSPGTYTPPLPQMPLPSPRTLRRAHLIVEMERMPVYRQSILSVTGEILCIDGTKQILKKVYGDGQGTMHFLTSILNEWGQFVTAVVVASESEECYQRLARGLSSRFRRANAPAPKVLYTDNNCCRDGGTSWNGVPCLVTGCKGDGMLMPSDIANWPAQMGRRLLSKSNPTAIRGS
ncbi:PREDICTED: uncharacterized protein LOC106816072 [Priapulus caudatus]|uniref:Uncharacterized protein LOC106816072 n=1 Tax=Priapulus caudatus TaxID=37621 RepID=A0ABM1EV94_PRICU|nr:PREDICTED: uncharacterized protein LOC106816072 [Priapulus caudatus]